MSDQRVTWYLPASGDRCPADYERGRPGWPRDVITVSGLSAAATVLDLAAGTGKLTRLLLPAFDSVVAVEPQGAMRRLLVTHCRDARCLQRPTNRFRWPTPRRRRLGARGLSSPGQPALGGRNRACSPAGGTLILMWNFWAGPWEPSIAAVEQLLRERLPNTQEFNMTHSISTRGAMDRASGAKLSQRRHSIISSRDNFQIRIPWTGTA